jgi:hypothetical protein
MRFLMALMAMTLFAISAGCEKPAEKPADKPADKPAETASTDTKTESPEVTLPDTAGTQTVSVKLPGMT